MRCDHTWGGLRAEHCPSCCQTFSSTTAGDMHRVGRHDIFTGPDRRRCLSAVEMLANGMSRNGKGYWMSPSEDWQTARRAV